MKEVFTGEVQGLWLGSTITIAAASAGRRKLRLSRDGSGHGLLLRNGVMSASPFHTSCVSEDHVGLFQAYRLFCADMSVSVGVWLPEFLQRPAFLGTPCPMVRLGREVSIAPHIHKKKQTCAEQPHWLGPITAHPHFADDEAGAQSQEWSSSRSPALRLLDLG